MADTLQINSAHVKGEPGTGFEKREDLGDFVCGNCEYYKNDSCGQADMMARSKEPRTKDGRVQVEDRDCCEYVDRVGREAYGGKPRDLLRTPIKRAS